MKASGRKFKKWGQFALRSELVKLMWIARFCRPDALYGSALPAKTFGDAGPAILNPVDFGEVIGVNIAKAVGVL